MPGTHRCDCGKIYAYSSGLSRHRKTCLRVGRPPRPAEEKEMAEPPAPPNIIIQHNAAVNIQNTVNILAVGGAAKGMPGWPVKWPVLDPPRPYAPPSFTITVEILRRAIAARAVNSEACLRGDPAAVATLLVEIVKMLHTDQYERNMYLNPSRADQVLVFVPDRWTTISLREAISLTLEHVVSELAEVLPRAG